MRDKIYYVFKNIYIFTVGTKINCFSTIDTDIDILVSNKQFIGNLFFLERQ